MNISIFLISVALYYAIHSLLAANRVKQLLHAIIPKRIYRIFYNIVAIGLLVPLVWMYFQIDHHLFFQKTATTSLLGWAVLIIGLILNLMAIRQYNLAEFSGISHLSDSEIQKPSTLNISGLNKWMRHPLYSTTLLVIIGVVLLNPNTAILGLAVISLIYILVGIQLEERKLIDEFGAEYLQYKKEVRMLIPFLF